MQKLVWQNANGVELDLTSGNYGITEWEGFSNTGLNIQTQTVPFQDGGVFLDALIEQRELTVTLAIQDRNNLELRYQQRRELISALNPKLGEGYLIYTNDFISKRIKCIPNIPIFETHNSDTAGTPKASLSWTACEPYWEDLEETVVEINAGEEVQINNTGDIPCSVKADIKSVSKNPILYNKTTQKEISLNGTFTQDVSIDTNVGNKKIEMGKMDFLTETGGYLEACCYGQGKYIYGGNITYIEDAYSGEIKQLDISEYVNSVRFINGKFFITTGQAILISDDGINWEKITISGNGYSDIAYGNNIYVLIGQSGGVYTSPDGITWTPRTSGVSVLLNKIIYANGLFVAIGNTWKIITSPDGITWTPRTSEFGFDLFDICFSATTGEYIVAGDGGTILTSPDGITWTQQTSGVTTGLQGIVCNNEKIIAVGNNGTVLISQDGINWEEQTSPVTKDLFNIMYANNLFIAVGIGGTIIKSPDGTQWEVKTSIANTNLTDIVYGNNLFVAVGGQGLIITSTDKDNWVKRESNVNETLFSITYSETLGLFVAVGNNGYVLKSNDGINWSYEIISYSLLSINYINDIFIITGSEGLILTSEDGITWTQQTSGVSVGLYNSAYKNGLYIIIGMSGTILTSPDGITWTPRISGVNNTLLRDIVCSEDIIVAVGSDNTIITSVNGINWVQRNLGLLDSDNFYSVTYGNGLFLTVRQRQQEIYISYDGIEWEKQDFHTGGNLYSCCFGENGFVIGGNVGIIIKSYISDMQNVISELTKTSDMTFNIVKGENKIIFNTETNTKTLLTYRQKYIGV